MRTLFITSTGTEIGKTFVTCALVRRLALMGVRARAIKPVLSGFDGQAPSTWAESDPGQLLQAMGHPVNLQGIERVSPFRFTAPLSPDVAAAREGRGIDLYGVVRFVTDCQAGPEQVLLVEGIGGAMVPLTDQATVRDLIRLLQMQALVVTGSYLGTISHTLTTVEALTAKGVAVSAVVLSESLSSPMPLDETRLVLEHHLNGIPVIALPRCSPGPDGWLQAPDLAAPLGLAWHIAQ
ncbi:MAG: dethiobiotin synthase [Bradymonadia bacterium]